MLSTQWLLMKRCDRLSCGEGRPHEPAAWYSIPLQNVTRRRELLENMQMRKYFIYFISLQGSSTTKLILGGLCDVWEGNINSVSLPVWKFFMADKKKNKKKNRKTSFVSNWFWVFCWFFFNAKALYVRERHAQCGSRHFVLVYYLYFVSNCSFAQRDSSIHTSVWNCKSWCGCCLVHQMAGSASATRAGGHLTKHGPTKTCTKNNKKEKLWIWEHFMFLLASLPIFGLQCSELGPFNTEPLSMGTEECHLFLTSFESQYSNNSCKVMYYLIT